ALKFTPNVNFNGSATFNYVSGYTGGTPAGSATDDTSAKVTITVNAVNSAPVVTVPGAQTATSENADVTFTTITVADNDVGETSPGELLMTVSTTSGTLTLGSTGSVNTVNGDGTAQITFKGTPAGVTTALNGLKLHSTSETGAAATVTIKADDQ